jgi:Spy/CpxP family protein refolding chaperone
MKTQFVKFFAVGALAAGMAFAQTNASPAPGAQNGTAHQAHRNFRERHLARIYRDLNLTDAQKTQATAIFDHARDSAMPVRAQLKQNRQALRAAVKADQTGKIDQLATLQGNLMGKMVAIHSEASAKFYQMLTPEQRVKDDLLHQQFRERQHERFNRRSEG